MLKWVVWVVCAVLNVEFYDLSYGAALRDNFKMGGADGEEILIKKNCRSGKMSYNSVDWSLAELQQ